MLLTLALHLITPATPATDLLPLTEADLNRTQESGCAFSFDQVTKTLLYTIGRDLMLRTPQGFALCRFDQAQLDAFTDAKRPLFCGGRTLRLRRTGATHGFPESDSAGWGATLTLTNGKTSKTLRGNAGVAC
ncbi:hypothetical protein [Sphingomonas xinjiangensis]|uniref:Uncharacterized protein n=1 Tax=Sphingomonas xinjiangensis TaxID=643568 RepID=A0A840YFF6_9SPHN|nr:hypothetical protein [Sphingomonas xinjiangensis]MBB5709508.1 hypothetical protein [Sphingomonas xinjiangensis]